NGYFCSHVYKKLFVSVFGAFGVLLFYDEMVYEIVKLYKMPRRIITEISQEQEAMLASYREKWRSLAISTESIYTQREKME
ncbi:MAG: hypothetical protein WBA07_23570, partial [Rivularia sp. (in: cyanobacteria)]